MNDISRTNEYDKMKVLNDIYRNENERIKNEYRILVDTNRRQKEQFQHDYDMLYAKYEQTVEMYENSLGIKLTKKIKKSYLYRFLVKIKKILIKRG